MPYIYTYVIHTHIPSWRSGFCTIKLGSHHFITCSFHLMTFHERFHTSLDALPWQQCERLCGVYLCLYHESFHQIPRHFGCLLFPPLEEAALWWAFSEINLRVPLRGAFRPHFQSEWLGLEGCSSLLLFMGREGDVGKECSSFTPRSTSHHLHLLTPSTLGCCEDWINQGMSRLMNGYDYLCYYPTVPGHLF